jgi:D-sedoheptulose 7-phosphate isomerase
MSNTIENAFARHLGVAEESAKSITASVKNAADVLLSAIKAGNKALVCGNGGSAADAQHFAGELVCKYKNDRRPLPAIALTADASAITAIGNDYGFENVFARQVEALGESGDILVAITTSGKSPNVLRAIEKAKKRGLKIVALTGANGRELGKLCDAAIIVPSEETARIQEIHELVLHSWCEYIDAEI